MAASMLDHRIERLAQDAARAGIFCDFDGALAPIVEDPLRARPIRGARSVLRRLARHFRVVAVISGRPTAYLAREMSAPGVRLVGLYGVETKIGRTIRIVPEAEQGRPAVERARDRLRDALVAERGVWVEDKGLAVAVHFRRAPDPDAARARSGPVVSSIAEEVGLAPVMRGRRVLEIGPRARVGKGNALDSIVVEEGLRGAFVAGDDAGDVPMFAAVEGLDPVLRVAVASSEAPHELLRMADHVVDGPAALIALLRRLADATGR